MTEWKGPGKVLFSVCLFGVFSVIAGAPLVAAFWPEESSGWRALPELLCSRAAWRLMGGSLIMALGAALGATLLGAPAGHALRYVSPRTRRIFLALLLLPIAAPSYVMAVAWIELAGHGGLLRQWIEVPLYNRVGAAFVLSCIYFPIPLLATLAAAQRIVPALEEAARLHAGAIRTFIRVTVPLAAPGTATGAACVLLLSLLSFSIPSLYQVPVYTSEIYERFSATHDAAGAAAAGGWLLACMALGGWLVKKRFQTYWSHLRHAPVFAGPQTSSSKMARWSSAYCLVLFTITAALPLLAILLRALPLASCAAAWNTARGEIACSLVVSLLTATAGVILAFFLSRVRSGLLPWVSAAAFCVSGPVLGVGLIRFWNHEGIRATVYDGMAILVIAAVARYLVFPHAGIRSVFQQIPPCIEEAAAVHGIGTWRRTFHVVLPLMAPALALWWGLLFILAWGELDTAVLVAPPGWTPVSVRLFSLMHYGPNSMVAALSLVSTLFAIAGAGGGFAAYRLLRRRIHG